MLLTGSVLVGASAAQLVAGKGWIGWPEVAAAVLAGVILPLTLADKLLGRFVPNASAAAEATWITRTLLLWQVAWLAAGIGWLGQHPEPLARTAWDGGARLVRQARRWAGHELPAEPAIDVPVPASPPEPGDRTEIRTEPLPAAPTAKPKPAPKPEPKPKPTPKPEPRPAPEPESAPPEPEVLVIPRPPTSRPSPAVVPRPAVRAPARRPAPIRRRAPGFYTSPEGLSPIPAGAEEPRRLHGEVPAEVARLAQDITRSAGTEMEKLRALHDWVAQNLTYDVAMYRSGRIRSQDPVEVLKKRTAVCEGYSRLLAAMLQAVGMRADVVPGWSRMSHETWADLLGRSPQANHAWNEVAVDGRVVRVDATWNSGYLDGSAFVPHFQHRYFDPDPAAFARSHSRARPATTPADPNHHYFLLPAGEQAALAEQAMQAAVRKPYFRGGRVYYWNSGLTARNDAGHFQALVMIQRDRDDISKGCKTLRFLRRNGSWDLKGMEDCPAEGYLPQEGYAPPASYR